MEVVDWARVLVVENSVNHLQSVGLLARLYMSEHLVGDRVCLSDRLSIGIYRTWFQKSCMHFVVLTACVDHYSDKGWLLDDKFNGLSASTRDLEGILKLETLVTDREMLWKWLVMASRELLQVTHVIKRLHDADTVLFAHGCHAKHGHVGTLGVSLVYRRDQVSVDTFEAV